MLRSTCWLAGRWSGAGGRRCLLSICAVGNVVLVPRSIQNMLQQDTCALKEIQRTRDAGYLLAGCGELIQPSTKSLSGRDQQSTDRVEQARARLRSQVSREFLLIARIKSWIYISYIIPICHMTTLSIRTLRLALLRCVCVKCVTHSLRVKYEYK